MFIFLADLILIIHILFVAVVVFGQILIVIGGIRKWLWIFNHWFRWIHLVMIFIVVSESWLGITCPLTTWESALRKLGGQSGYQQDFIADWLGKILFYNAPGWVFTLIYTVFFILVLASFILWPPEKKPTA